MVGKGYQVGAFDAVLQVRDGNGHGKGHNCGDGLHDCKNRQQQEERLPVQQLIENSPGNGSQALRVERRRHPAGKTAQGVVEYVVNGAVPLGDEHLHEFDEEADKRAREGAEQQGLRSVAIKQEHIHHEAEGNEQEDIPGDVGEGEIVRVRQLPDKLPQQGGQIA